MNLQAFQKLEEKLASARRDRDRAAGALAQLLGRLKEEFGAGSLGEGRKLLKRLWAEAAKAGAGAETARQAFEEEFGELLGE